MEKQTEETAPAPPAQPLGAYLRYLRDVRSLTLREVQEASGVSNAYLSQLEHEKISKPSPHILYKLASVYNVPYEKLMEKAGYIKRSEEVSSSKTGRRGRVPLFAQEELTQEEEEALLEYLAFLRSRRGKK